MTTTRVEFEKKFGGKASGDLAVPAGDEKVPAVVLIQEWWGLNDHIRDIAQRLAKEGFLTLAVDLYHGTTTKDPGEAAKLSTDLDRETALDEIEAAAMYLADHPRARGRIGVIGFCMGGSLTFRALERISDFSCGVPFYGVPPAEQYNVAKVRAPILGHFSRTDPWAKPSIAEQIQRNLTARGGTMTVHVYDAEHAFMNDTRPEVYSPENAKVAWKRSVDFLHQQLD